MISLLEWNQYALSRMQVARTRLTSIASPESKDAITDTKLRQRRRKEHMGSAAASQCDPQMHTRQVRRQAAVTLCGD